MAISVESLIQTANALAPPTDAGAEIMRTGVATAEAGLQTKRAGQTSALSVHAELTEKRSRWIGRGTNARTESAADRKVKAVKFSKGASRCNLDEYAATIAAAQSLQLAIADVVAEIDISILEAEAAEKSAARAVKIAEREYFYRAGLEAAWQANRAWLPLLELESNVEINMNDSRVAAFVTEILRLDKELSA